MQWQVDRTAWLAGRVFRRRHRTCRRLPAIHARRQHGSPARCCTHGHGIPGDDHRRAGASRAGTATRGAGCSPPNPLLLPRSRKHGPDRSNRNSPTAQTGRRPDPSNSRPSRRRPRSCRRRSPAPARLPPGGLRPRSRRSNHRVPMPPTCAIRRRPIRSGCSGAAWRARCWCVRRCRTTAAAAGYS